MPLSDVSLQAIAAPDDSEIITTLDAKGAKTETRTFKSNSRVAKVVVITRDGNQTAQAHSIAGEVRDLPQDKVASALEATGDSLADAVGFVRPFDEKSKSIAATKQGKTGASPSAKAPGQKTTVAGTKTASSTPAKSGTMNPNSGSSTESVSNVPISNELPGVSNNVEQKKSQDVDSGKQRMIKGIPPKGTPQPRALKY